MLTLSARSEALADLGRDFHQRGWLPATSGNLSGRLQNGNLAITASGRHKGRLREGDFLEVDLEGMPVTPGRPSAETLLHCSLYRQDPGIDTVFHVHSPAATVVSMCAEEAVVLSGYEIAKAFPGVVSHVSEVLVPIFANDQDIRALAAAVERRRPLLPGPAVPGYLIAGHGLYCWGASLEDAYRHIEAFEFLFHCFLLRR